MARRDVAKARLEHSLGDLQRLLVPSLYSLRQIGGELRTIRTGLESRRAGEMGQCFFEFVPVIREPSVDVPGSADGLRPALQRPGVFPDSVWQLRESGPNRQIPCGSRQKRWH